MRDLNSRCHAQIMRCQPVELYDSCLYFYKLAIINHTLYNRSLVLEAIVASN